MFQKNYRVCILFPVGVLLIGIPIGFIGIWLLFDTEYSWAVLFAFAPGVLSAMLLKSDRARIPFWRRGTPLSDWRGPAGPVSRVIWEVSIEGAVENDQAPVLVWTALEREQQWWRGFTYYAGLCGRHVVFVYRVRR